MTLKDMGNALTRDNLFSKIVVAVMVAAGVFEVLTVSTNAVMRYIVRRDIRAVEEFITMVAFWMYFCGAIYAAKRRAHISAEALTLFCKNPRILYGLQVFKRVSAFLICLIFAWWGLEFFWWGVTEGGHTNIYKIPQVVGHVSVTIGFCAMLTYYARDLIMLLRCKPSEYQPDSV
jgi:TRAP-type C4-dicarboxylate transport system permease small subunit